MFHLAFYHIFFQILCQFFNPKGRPFRWAEGGVWGGIPPAFKNFCGNRFGFFQKHTANKINAEGRPAQSGIFPANKK
jgi:hypothetical protein